MPKIDSVHKDSEQTDTQTKNYGPATLIHTFKQKVIVLSVLSLSAKNK